ncbi:DUF5666 domain-containing protein [Pseudoalteromonas sp. KG3]|uniref:DUF5666 domain-containing protein n=1 Tax=Pseudoalteromonas TaxID=53246 RepID=UPI0026594DF7|nr:DUF5666 domain-containing protein [Pseudoalteromonas sp. KG3]WKD25546.1 DUF5666 domain-containing protein [Pseudoalteromonas sp. KG3]
MHSQHKKITQIISLSALTLALTACGSSNSQSNELTKLPSVLIGELTATTATTITVNQHEIPASNAEVEIDGVDGSLSDLKKGMMVEVETNGSHATEIDYDPNFKGPVQVQGNVINIAGVRLTGFDSSMVKDGDLVEVSGYNSAYNRLTVTYQQPISDPQTELEVEGVISALNTQQRTFSLGNILINYQQADVDGPLVNGQFVEVEGFMNGQQLLANEVDAKQHSSFDDDTDSQLAGQVTWLNNDSTLMTINGQWQVSLNAQTRYDDGTVADLAIGRFVEIDALWQQANNRFVAQEIEFGSANDVVNSNSAFSVTGLVTYTQGVATINGIEFILNNQTVFDDGLTLNNIEGRWLELEGIIADDKQTVSEVELMDGNEPLNLTGFVSADQNMQASLWGYVSEDNSLDQYLDQYVELECQWVAEDQVTACRLDD